MLANANIPDLGKLVADGRNIVGLAVQHWLNHHVVLKQEP